MLEQLGMNIKKLRKARGMTQEELADKANTTKQSILKIEKGETVPLSTTLYAIASSLGTTMETLFNKNRETNNISEHMVLDTLRQQLSFNELYKETLQKRTTDELSQKERTLLLSELGIDHMSNRELYKLILLKQKADLENVREKYLDI